jgi:hypothetical protein
MREIRVYLDSFPWPYLFFIGRRPSGLELTPAQRRAVAMMREGVWYEREVGDPLPITLDALVWKGRCWRAVIARRGQDGKLALWTHEEHLVHALFDESPKIEQPLILYRLENGAKAGLGQL